MLRKEVNALHFIGVCGTAMAAVAALCRDRGYTVTGSDENVYPPMSTFLEARGIRILTGYRETNLDQRPDLVVIGNAMRRGNPEVERVLDERLNYCSLPDLVRESFIRGNHSIVVAGTHGKTTTTALLAWTLDCAGLQPGFLIGGIPNNFPEGGARACASPPAHQAVAGPIPEARRGSPDPAAALTAGLLRDPQTTETFGRREGGVGRPSPNLQAETRNPKPETYFVIEGDEYDTAFFDKRSKFVHYLPDMVILNNLEFDHADIFPDLAAVKRAFRQLVAIVPRRGQIIANGDDPNVREVLAGAPCRVRWFDRTHAEKLALPLPGEHNRLNAAAVAACAGELGLTGDQIQQAFAAFTGVKRRLEVRGEVGGVTVLDDFAHHPTAITQTLRAIREKYPQQRVWALFEPRSNTTRRNVFQRELAESLAQADGVFIGRIDRLAELPETERLNPELIVTALRDRGKPAEYSPSAATIVERLLPRLEPRDVVAVFSNGRFDGIHDQLLTRLAARA